MKFLAYLLILFNASAFADTYIENPATNARLDIPIPKDTTADLTAISPSEF
ncbi:MAG: hypothetical protein IPG06_16820 [Haliea sp.]|nr:hypothetical protein [Haliea sp.]